MIVSIRHGNGLGFWGQVAQAAVQSQESWIDFYKYLTTEKYTKKRLDLENKALKLQIDIAERKATLENDLIKAQKKIAEIQAAGMEKRNEIELKLAQAQAEYLEKQLALVADLDVEKYALLKVQTIRDKENEEYLLNLERSNRNSQTYSDGTFSDGSYSLGSSSAVLPYDENITLQQGETVSQTSQAQIANGSQINWKIPLAIVSAAIGIFLLMKGTNGKAEFGPDSKGK